MTPNSKTAIPAAKEMAKPVSDDLLVKDTAFAKKKLLKTSLFWCRILLILGCIIGFYYNQHILSYRILLQTSQYSTNVGPINIR